MELVWVLAIGLVAGTIGGVIGFGSGVIMVPVLAWTYGPKAAVPIMAIAGLLANLSRAGVWWREVDWRSVAAYSATGIPFAYLGSRTLLALDSVAIEATLGVFLLAMIPVRRRLAASGWRISRPQLAIVGAAIGFLTGIVASTGPINAPFFLMHGLVKGAYLATEAMGSAAIQVTKAITFERFGALSPEDFLRGLAAGGALMAGSFLGKRIVQRMSAHDFRLLIEVMLAAAGLAMLAAALLGGT